MNGPFTSLKIFLGCALFISLASSAPTYSQTNAKSFQSDSEARKLISDSPWAKRSRLRSIAKAQTFVQPIEQPASKSGGFGPAGPGHGVVPPTTDQIISQAGLPCLGWGISVGALPTAEECKAASRSVSEIKSTGLPQGSVVILWESAEPVRAAKLRLGIDEAFNVQTSNAIVISVIAHPLLRQINPAGSMKPMVRDAAVLIRNGKSRVQASDVAFIETDDSLVRFYFPRLDTFQTADKEIIFRFEIQETFVEAKFNLKDMSYQGHRAL